MKTPTLLPGSGSHRRSRGFSLLEIVVVLVLFGLAAAVILPSFSGGFKSLEMETAARDLVTRMKQSRSEAIAKQEVLRIVLKPGTGDEVSAYVLTNAYEEEIKTFELPKDISFELGEELKQATVSFYPNGRSSGGEFALRNKQGKRLTVEVDSVTGYGRVRRVTEDSTR